MRLDREQVIHAFALLREQGIDLETIAQYTVQQAVNKALRDINQENVREAAKTHVSVEHNVKVLLQNYHLLKACRDNAVYDLATLTDESDYGFPRNPEVQFDAIDDLMKRTISKHDVKVTSVERAASRTHLLIEDLDAALADYQRRCINSAKESDRRRWRVLEARWLSETPRSTESIAQDESYDKRTIQKDLKRAVDDLTFMLFGSEAIRRVKARRD